LSDIGYFDNMLPPHAAVRPEEARVHGARVDAAVLSASIGLRLRGRQPAAVSMDPNLLDFETEFVPLLKWPNRAGYIPGRAVPDARLDDR